MSEREQATDRLYGLLNRLAPAIGGPKTLSDPALSRSCPRAGMYFFFEAGEIRDDGSPRVVRIGTHGLTSTSQASLWGRLRQHRGRLGGSNPGGGDHRGSIFRHHVGSAVLTSRGDTELLASWMSQSPRAEHRAAERAVEVEVSQAIREMPFLWLAVPTRADGTSDRGLLERNLIGLLSTLIHPGDEASPRWLGRQAVAAKVRGSSLWNVNHVGEAFDVHVLNILERYVQGAEIAAGRP